LRPHGAEIETSGDCDEALVGIGMKVFTGQYKGRSREQDNARMGPKEAPMHLEDVALR